jgi:argininosuccinate lyase
LPQNGLPKGRFNKAVAKTAQRFSGSVSFDWRLYRYDIAGSIAHAAALARSEIKKHSSLFAETPQVFDVHRSLAKRKAIGAPSPKNIAAQIKRWRVRL